MMQRRCGSVVVVLMLLATGLLFSVASPAWACGCGAYVPDNPGAAVADERALLTWDGTTENILMSFGVTGSSERAAWVMPVPAAAQASLGETGVFEELGRLTAPRLEYRDSWWPTFTWLWGAGAPDTASAPRGNSVDVLSSQRIGPFDVTRLSANDPTALAKWLADKGFPHPDGLDENLAPYVADGWEVIAIQLTPAEQGKSLTGDLQPLRLSFKSSKVIYPMRLSRAASTPQFVDLYVLADHRMDPTMTPVPGVKPSLKFAGPIDNADITALSPYVRDGAFLTRWTDEIYDPAAINGDYAFEKAPLDTAFRPTIYRIHNRGDITGVFVLVAIIAGGVAIARALGRRVSRR